MPQSDKSQGDQLPQAGEVHDPEVVSEQGKDLPRETGPKPQIKRMVETMAQQLMMEVRSGPAPNAFVEKLTPEHIDKLLDNSHKGTTEKGRLNFAIVISLMVAIFALCWLFLAYGETQHVSAVIALIIGLAGGFGAGRAYDSGRN